MSQADFDQISASRPEALLWGMDGTAGMLN